MAKKLDHRFWAKYFKVYDVLNMVIPYQELLDTIVDEAKIKKGDLVLDAGCGTGNLSMKCKAAGAKVIGIDYCIEALDRYKQKDPDAEMFVHDLTKPLPFPDNYFDVVVCNNVLYALGKVNKQKVVREFWRVLGRGGSLVVSDPLTGFKIMNVYKRHIRDSISKSGYIRSIFMLIRMILPTIKMIRYNLLIKSQNKNGGYKFSGHGENELMFEQNNIHVIDITRAYDDQSEVIKGKK